jgi:hypothetical protein
METIRGVGVGLSPVNTHDTSWFLVSVPDENWQRNPQYSKKIYTPTPLRPPQIPRLGL